MAIIIKLSINENDQLQALFNTMQMLVKADYSGLYYNINESAHSATIFVDNDKIISAPDILNTLQKILNAGHLAVKVESVETGYFESSQALPFSDLILQTIKTYKVTNGDLLSLIQAASMTDELIRELDNKAHQAWIKAITPPDSKHESFGGFPLPSHSTFNTDHAFPENASTSWDHDFFGQPFGGASSASSPSTFEPRFGSSYASSSHSSFSPHSFGISSYSHSSRYTTPSHTSSYTDIGPSYPSWNSSLHDDPMPFSHSSRRIQENNDSIMRGIADQRRRIQENNAQIRHEAEEQRRRVQQENELMLKREAEKRKNRLAAQERDRQQRDLEQHQRQQVKEDAFIKRIDSENLLHTQQQRLFAVKLPSIQHERKTKQNSQIKIEKTQLATLAFLKDAIENKWSSQEIRKHFPTYYVDNASIDLPINTKLNIGDKNGVIYHLTLADDVLDRENSSYIEHFTSIAPVFTKAMLRLTAESGIKITGLDNEPICTFITIFFNDVAPNPKLTDMLVFCARVALMSIGLINHAALSITQLLTQQNIDNFRLLDILTKYQLIHDGQPLQINAALLEKATRMAAANNLVDDLKALMNGFDGININNQDSNQASKRTPLHLAVERGHLDMVTCLLALDAKIDIPDAKGNTVADISDSSPHSEVAFLIQKKKAEDLEKVFHSISLKK